MCRDPYAESCSDALINFVSRDHYRGIIRSFRSAIRICERALETAQPAYGQWRLLIRLLYFRMAKLSPFIVLAIGAGNSFTTSSGKS